MGIRKRANISDLISVEDINTISQDKLDKRDSIIKSADNYNQGQNPIGSAEGAYHAGDGVKENPQYPYEKDNLEPEEVPLPIPAKEIARKLASAIGRSEAFSHSLSDVVVGDYEKDTVFLTMDTGDKYEIKVKPVASF